MLRPQYITTMVNKVINEFSHYFYFVTLAATSYFKVQKAKQTGMGVKNYDFDNWRSVVNYYVNCAGQTDITLFIAVLVD
jgi:hypothetical protein